MRHMKNNTHTSKYNSTVINLGTRQDLPFTTLCLINVVYMPNFTTIIHQTNLTLDVIDDTTL